MGLKILLPFILLFCGGTAQAQQVRFVYSIGTCQGFLARMNPQAATVYLFSAGHCVSGVKSFDDPDRIVIRKDIGKTKEFQIYGAGKVQSDQVLFASYQSVDFAILKIKQSVSDLQKMGITPYVLSAAQSPLSTQVTVHNLDVSETTSCTIEHYPYQMTYREAVWLWSGRLAQECQITHGWSGAAVLNALTNEVIGLVAGGNETGDCTDYCEVEKSGTQSAFKDQTYFSRLDFLHSCADALGEIVPELCHLK